MAEEWRPVQGYEGRYEVSDKGNVASLDYHREGYRQNLVPGETELGYQSVLLYSGDGTRVTRRVHRLVADAFLPPDPERPQINHKNGRPSDNRLKNLERATALENLMHSFEYLGRMVAKGPDSKCSKEYIATAPDGTVYEVKGLNAFCKEQGLLQGEMTNVVSGRAKTHRGWRCQHKPTEGSDHETLES